MLQLAESLQLNRGVLLLPLFVAQVVALLFLCFIIPGLADDENGDSKYVFLLVAYYVSLWLGEAAFLLHLNWTWVVMFPLLVMLIHWFMMIGGCCAKEGKLVSLWVSIVLLGLMFTLLAVPLVTNERMEKKWAALPITVLMGVQFVIAILS
jgi:hypothetical protein